jgi:hypothetical protein
MIDEATQELAEKALASLEDIRANVEGLPRSEYTGSPNLRMSPGKSPHCSNAGARAGTQLCQLGIVKPVRHA